MKRFMRRNLFVAVLLALFTALLYPAGSFSQVGRLQGRVTRVWDGDSINVKTGRGSVEVRLAYIDAPEKRRAKAKMDRAASRGQPYGEAARDLLKYKVVRRIVRVDVVDIDRYGRVVGIVFCDGRDINLEMVREGYAWAYRDYLGTPYASGYLDAEAEARRGDLGLWRQPNPEPPWEFRKRTKTSLRQGEGAITSPGEQWWKDDGSPPNGWVLPKRQVSVILRKVPLL